MKIIKMPPLFYLRNEIRGLSYRDKMKFLWREGWEKAPAMVVFIFLSVGCVFGTIGYNLTAQDGDKYRQSYTVYRPDDRRVATIRLTDKVD